MFQAFLKICIAERKQIIIDAVWKYLSSYILFILLFTLVVFFIYEFTFMTSITEFQTYLFAIIFLLLIFHFLYKYQNLFSKQFPFYLEKHLIFKDEDSAYHYKNHLDLLKKEQISDLELEYLKLTSNRIEMTSLRRSKLILNSLNIFGLMIQFTLILNLDSYQNYIGRLLNFKDETSSSYRVLIESNSNKQSIDSLFHISIQHNIPFVQRFLFLQLSDSNKQFSEESILAKANHRFAYSGLRKGKVRIIVLTNFKEQVVSNLLDFEFIRHFEIDAHKIKIDAPSYTKISDYQISSYYGVQVPKGSEILWTIDLNKPATEIKSNFEQITTNLTSFKHRIYQDKSFHFYALDADSQILDFKSPAIKIIPDLAPIIVLKSPNGGLNISSAEPINFVISGMDDYGFSKVELHYFIDNPDLGLKTDKVIRRISKEKEKLFQEILQWDISKLDLFPGMDIYCQFVAYDNNGVDGFQSAKSETVKIHLLSMDELFVEFKNAQEKIKENLSEIQQKRIEALKQLQKLQMKLNQKGNLNFSERKELEDQLKTFNEINKQLEEQKNQLERLKQEADKKKLFDNQMVEQFQEIKKMLDELKLLQSYDEKKIQEKNPNELKKSMAQIQDNENKMKEQMERIQELLKKLKQKQENEHLVNKARDFADKQNKINKKEKEGDLKTADSQQEKLGNEIEKLMEETSSNQLQQSLKKELEKKQIVSRMKKAKQNNTADRKQIESDLNSLSQQMEEEMRNDEDANKKAILRQMENNIKDLLYLSIEQERLSNISKGISVYSNDFYQFKNDQDLIKSQIEIVHENLKEIAYSSFLFNPRILQILESAKTESEEALKYLAERDNTRALLHQLENMSKLNLSLMMLENNRQSMQNASGSMGEKEFKEMMQQMAGMQQGINSESQDLWQLLQEQARKTNSEEKNGQNQSQQGNNQSGEEQLATKQNELAQDLEDFLNQQSQSNQSGGQARAEEMLKEMKEIAEQLKLKKLNETLLKRQEKLLEKMLNSANSGKERKEKDDKREKVLAKEFEILSPNELDQQLGQGSYRLIEQLERVLRNNNDPTIKKILENYYNNMIQLNNDSLKLNR